MALWLRCKIAYNREAEKPYLVRAFESDDRLIIQFQMLMQVAKVDVTESLSDNKLFQLSMRA